MVHYFSSDPTNISLYVGIDIGYKSIVQLKFYALPMHQIYIVKYCTFLKLVFQNKIELQGKSMAFKMILSRFQKVTAYCKILSSSNLTVQPHQNIGKRSN